MSDPDLEREKWQFDSRLRERALSLREEQLHFKHREEQRSRWANPLVLAVLAAALAAIGNATVAYINGAAQRELETTRTKGQATIEETRAEAARILEMIKTGDPISARRNLKFLNETGLIANPERHAAIDKYLEVTDPLEGPSLPQYGSRDRLCNYKDSLMKELAEIDTDGDPADVMNKMTGIQLKIQEADMILSQKPSTMINGDGRLNGTWAEHLRDC